MATEPAERSTSIAVVTEVIAGVCAGVAAYFGVDVTLVRLGFAIFTIFWGLGALLYLVAWAVIPEEGENASVVENLINKQR